MMWFLKLMNEGGGSEPVPVIRHEDADAGDGGAPQPPAEPHFEPTPPDESASGRIEPGEPLPSAEELARRYQVADEGGGKGGDKPFLVYQGKTFQTEKDFNEYMESQSRPKVDEDALLNRWRQEQEEREERLVQRLLKEGVGGRRAEERQAERPASRIPKAEDNPFSKEENPDEHWRWELDRRDALHEAKLDERLSAVAEQNETVTSRVEELRDRAERAELIGAFDEMFESFTDDLRVPDRARPLLHRMVMTDPNIDARRLTNVKQIVAERWRDLQSYTDGTEADRGKELLTKSGKVTASPLRGSAAHLIRGKVKEERPGKMEGDSSFYEHWKRRQAAERLATEE